MKNTEGFMQETITDIEQAQWNKIVAEKDLVSGRDMLLSKYPPFQDWLKKRELEFKTQKGEAVTYQELMLKQSEIEINKTEEDTGVDTKALAEAFGPVRVTYTQRFINDWDANVFQEIDALTHTTTALKLNIQSARPPVVMNLNATISDERYNDYKVFYIDTTTSLTEINTHVQKIIQEKYPEQFKVVVKKEKEVLVQGKPPITLKISDLELFAKYVLYGSSSVSNVAKLLELDHPERNDTLDTVKDSSGVYRNRWSPLRAFVDPKENGKAWSPK